MPVDQKIDPFKPVQPTIPGVEPSTEKPKEEPAVAQTAYHASQAAAFSPDRARLIGVAIAGAVLFSTVCGGALYVRHMSRAAGSTPSSAETPAPQAQLEKPAAAKTPAALPVGPGPVATTDELSRPWSSKRFMFPDSVTSQLQPALVVRLPGGAFWGFSLREPFGTCELELVTDLQKLRVQYNFPADHPMVGNACSQTVYDLLQYGAGAGGGLVRGDVVHGSGIRPPVAIEIRANGKEVVAVRAE
jgi:hypothetical protein